MMRKTIPALRLTKSGDRKNCSHRISLVPAQAEL